MDSGTQVLNPAETPAVADGISRASYRFGRCCVRLQADDADFGRRFAHIFSDCRHAADSGAFPAPLQARLSSSAEPDWVTLELSGSDHPLADARVLPAILPELGLQPVAASDTGENHDFHIAGDPARIVAQVSARGLRLHKSLPWQVLAGHYLVHQVLRSQQELVFLHAATVTVDHAAVLLCGDKGAGKSTLSLTLAGRGHGFLGDEVAVLQPRTRACLPFQRSVSLRRGPLGRAAAERLARHPVQDEVLADGTTRVRAPVSRLFPAAMRGEAPLRAAFFLAGFAPAPRAERFAFASAHLGRLEPLHASFAQQPAGHRALELLRLFAALPCFWLTAGGSPDATAELIERTLEEVWA